MEDYFGFVSSSTFPAFGFGFTSTGTNDNWILRTGFWRDAGVWVDTDFWID